MKRSEKRKIRESTRNKVAKKYKEEVEYWKDLILGVREENTTLTSENFRLNVELNNLRKEYEELKRINELLRDGEKLYDSLAQYFYLPSSEGLVGMDITPDSQMPKP